MLEGLSLSIHSRLLKANERKRKKKRRRTLPENNERRQHFFSYSSSRHSVCPTIRFFKFFYFCFSVDNSMAEIYLHRNQKKKNCEIFKFNMFDVEDSINTVIATKASSSSS